MPTMPLAPTMPPAPADVCNEPLTPILLLERTLRVFPERVGVIYREQRISYRELGREVGRLAAALRRAGVRAGDRVAVLLPNTPLHLVAHFAMPLLQAPLVSLNTRLAAAEIAYILEHSGAKVLLVDPELAPPLDDALPKIATLEQVVEVADGDVPARVGARSYDDFAAGVEPLPIRSELTDEHATLSINYTSGTTGRPKGVLYSHRGAYLNAMGQIGALSLGRQTTFLWTLPMFHCNGWCMPWAVTAAGGRHVCLRAIDPPEVFRLIEAHGVTNFNAAPTVLGMLSSDPAAKDRRFEPTVHVCTGGSPPSPTLLTKMESLGIQVMHLYGLTETYGPHTFCQPQDEWQDLDPDVRARVKARQGVPFVHATHLRVVDDAMRDVPADATTMGEVVMRGNNVMQGYYRAPDATAEAFRGGWFHSGDVGVMHPDGYIELRDRSKDIIISGGENISTIEVENTLYRHPDVLEVAVVGVPHEKWGEVPKAFVCAKPGSEATEASLIEFTRKHLSHFKCPKSIEFCELPKTATGKIQKFKLREREWSGKQRRIQG
jgi:fatty-acyl-CoA synthase